MGRQVALLEIAPSRDHIPCWLVLLQGVVDTHTPTFESLFGTNYAPAGILSA